MEARVRSVTRRRATQRRVALAAGVSAVALAAWLPLRAGIGAPTAHDAPQAIDTRAHRRVVVPGPQGSVVPRSGGTASAPATTDRPHSHTGASTHAEPVTPSGGAGQPRSGSHATSHPSYPVVKMEKKVDQKGVELVAIKTPNASAVANVAAVNAGVANIGLNVATVMCAVDGADTLTVGETGTWTAISSHASEAHWPNGDPASAPYSQAFATPGTYEIVLDVTYDGLANMQCHRSVTVVAPPVVDPPVIPDPAPPVVEPDPGAVNPSVEPSGQPVEVTAEGTDGSADGGVGGGEALP
jgi:hypothetical protein